MAAGQRIGYIRVSSVDQNTARQLEGVPLDRVFTDKCSGKDTNRPQLQECMAYARSGDEIFVHELARLARSLFDLRSLVDFFTCKGCVVHFTKEALTFCPGNAKPMEKLMLNLLGSLAEFERELIRERQAEGIALAKERGVYKGRKRKLTVDQVQEIREQIADGIPKSDLAQAYGISRPTLYEYLRTTPWPNTGTTH